MPGPRDRSGGQKTGDSPRLRWVQKVASCTPTSGSFRSSAPPGLLRPRPGGRSIGSTPLHALLPLPMWDRRGIGQQVLACRLRLLPGRTRLCCISRCGPRRRRPSTERSARAGGRIPGRLAAVEQRAFRVSLGELRAQRRGGCLTECCAHHQGRMSWKIVSGHRRSGRPLFLGPWTLPFGPRRMLELRSGRKRSCPAHRRRA